MVPSVPAVGRNDIINMSLSLIRDYCSTYYAVQVHRERTEEERREGFLGGRRKGTDERVVPKLGFCRISHKPVYHVNICRTLCDTSVASLFFRCYTLDYQSRRLEKISSTSTKVDGRRLLMFARVERVVFLFLFLRSGVMPILSLHILRRRVTLSSSNRPLATLKLVTTSSTSLEAFESTSDVIADVSYLDKKPSDDEVLRLHSFLQSKRNVLVITGAGISTSSGVPDYRGPLGSYKLGMNVLTRSELSVLSVMAILMTIKTIQHYSICSKCSSRVKSTDTIS
jgi:hypothetical protein